METLYPKQASAPSSCPGNVTVLHFIAYEPALMV
jgi:hypothetical protein